MRSPRITLRRLWDRDAYGLWIGEDINGKFHYAKPAELKLEPASNEYMLQPEPTFVLPRVIAKMIFEQFVQELEMQGESATQSKQVLDAKNENLKDLRHVIDKLFAGRAEA